MKPFTARNLWFALFVVVLFATGVGTGLTLARYWPPGAGFGPGPGHPPPPAALADRMARELELTSEQRDRIEEVFKRGAERFERFHAVTGEQFDAMRQQLNTEIEQLLTPDQRARFRHLRPDRGGRRPPPPPPAGPPPGD